MTHKIKLFFVFLAVSAVVSVMSFFDVFHGVRSAKLFDSVQPLPIDTTQDADQDGLSDSDESYWDTDFQNPDTDSDGFLDGEEVASGRDPNQAGPDDQLLNINITKRMADIAVAGLAEGSLQPDNPLYSQSLNDLTDTILDDGLRSLNPSDPSHITIVDSSKDNQQQYVSYSEKIWEMFLKSLGEEIESIGQNLELSNNGGFNNSEYISYFNSKVIEFQNITNRLEEVKVPQNWKEDHIDFYHLISQMVIVNKALTDAKNDSIKAMMSFNLLSDITDILPQLIYNYAQKIKTESLSGNYLFD
ncbi:MAG: hypothetical protein A2817_00315 [Candidatus Yanofskybacteria bacterium RIFCSPHIGHO2_01_FULL_39_8b]|uniref:EF-hand domain-containing protein n=1 Tax=Candidatus Yanofskybacteria bacterium RIFCSPHIGHO2_01_FULL_39_8b TaxID=1802659 RepID=A0A1F8EFP7_9BACT|nr:MAG: hypothetical protein A2817_00315 [Candidatus Yanofskybacteria bacterium RIFCSPHIGHO2_01_FULL_39_8b]